MFANTWIFHLKSFAKEQQKHLTTAWVEAIREWERASVRAGKTLDESSTNLCRFWMPGEFHIFRFFCLAKYSWNFFLPRVENMCHTHMQQQMTKHAGKAQAFACVIWQDCLLTPPSLSLCPRHFSHTKQWMSSGAHWVFIRFTHVRWIYDEFSTRKLTLYAKECSQRGYPFSVKFSTRFFSQLLPPFLPLFRPVFFLLHFRRLYEACKIVTVFNRKIYATT